jgi:hypothetical protein
MGLRLKQSPPEIYLQNFEKKYAVSRLNVIISGGIYKKNTKKEMFHTAPMFVKSNERSLNVKFIWISSHPPKMG